MPIRVTLKVSKRDKRYLEVALTEDQLALCRTNFWQDYVGHANTLDLKRAEEVFRSSVGGLWSRDEHIVILHAIATISLFVGGTYWYKDRHPKSSPHARIRVFVDENGHIHCPKCQCLLADGKDYHVQPHEFSKLMKNPHFICYQCNSHVIVSSRRSEYESVRQGKRVGQEAGDDRSPGRQDEEVCEGSAQSNRKGI